MKKLLLFLLMLCLLISCNKKPEELVELDILDRVDQEVKKDIDKISEYNIHEIEEKVGERQVDIPEDKRSEAIDLLLKEFSISKAKDEIYKMKSNNMISEEQSIMLENYLKESQGDSKYLLQKLIDDPLFDNLLIGTYDQETINKIKLLLKNADWGSLSLKDSNKFKNDLLDSMINEKKEEDFEERWKEYDQETKDLIKSIESKTGKEVQLYVANLQMNSVKYKEKIYDQGMMVVTNLVPVDKYADEALEGFVEFSRHEGYKVLKNMEEIDAYYNEMYNLGADYIAKHPEIMTVYHDNTTSDAQKIIRVWISCYRYGNQNDPITTEKWYGRIEDDKNAELEKRLNVLIEERNPGIRDITNYIKLNEDKSSPAKYINTLGNGEYHLVDTDIVTITKSNKDYMRTLPPAKTNGRPLWSEIEKEVFKLNNPGVRFISGDPTPRTSYSRKTYFADGTPLWIDRNPDSRTYNYEGEMYCPHLVDNGGLECFTKYTQGSHYAFLDWAYDTPIIDQWFRTPVYTAVDPEHWEDSGLLALYDSMGGDALIQKIEATGTY